VPSPRDIFRTYADDQRSRKIDGFLLEVLPNLSRHTAQTKGAEGLVAFAGLPPGQEDLLIDEQIEHFTRIGQDFEWKVHEFDSPADLRGRLERRGFRAHPVEAFCVLPVDGEPAPVRLNPAFTIRRVSGEEGIRDLFGVLVATCRENLGWYLEALLRTIATRPEAVSFYCAYSGGMPIGCGRIDFLCDSPFAELHAGAVIPEFRGKGVYSALFQTRLIAARERGYRYLAVDAAPMSRPILAAKGFVHVCETWPMKMKGA
jgi:GNAT superfamily N-acetyltransferase